MPLGISPARALGPAPTQLQPFTTPSHHDSHTTPTNAANVYKPSLLSSSIASSSDGSSSVDRPIRLTHSLTDLSDDDNDSPTKRVGSRAPVREPSLPESARSTAAIKKVAGLATRPGRPLPAKAVSSSGGGRTSAKFVKVAEDPGVEGIPPGPRSSERPQQSFACIIGQAILKSSAGGLSLEHIYRYVETAYPYFKTVDQWRNSVRHNLSIHKIFITIPRTDKHPPGKGGIWVIDDPEKIHWPSEDKFIKNFPPNHPHHAVCRQTIHERAVEKRLKEKAEAEGREYVPRKSKKVRKLNLKDDELKKTELKPAHGLTPTMLPHLQPPVRGPMGPPLPSSPPRRSSQAPPSLDFEDDGDFVPVGPDPGRLAFQLGNLSRPRMGHSGLGPAIGADLVEHVRDDDDENVFTSGPKRVRMAQPDALSPILEQQVTNAYLNDDDDMFITPSRERSKSTTAASASRQFGSSALKTPALVQTSSSPTSSPMPPTITRGSHHPSGLQQAWTHDDMMQATTSLSSHTKLDAAFDLKPTPMKRDRDDDTLFVHHAERGPPKTPVTRSSAASDRTPRVGGVRTPGMLIKTPLTYGSPARPPPSASAHMSTPLWEMSGVLDRLKDSDSPTRASRHDVPPTSPTHYSLSECGDSPVAKRRKVSAA